jgi:hypothetical protein
MNAISTRQHLVPGFLDGSEDEIAAPRSPRLDFLTVFTGVIVALSVVALFLATR